MRERIVKMAGACLLAVVTAVWGFSYDLQPEEPVVQAVSLGEPDASLIPGEWAQGGAAFRNLGTVPCRLRVKICAAVLDGKPVLEAGCEIDGQFVSAGNAQPDSDEYWTARGEYLYYRNSATGDLLPPGRESPPVYNAVRLNTSLSTETLESLPEEQQLFVVAQARREGGDWQNIGG